MPYGLRIWLGAILIVGVIILVGLAAAYVECWTFGRATYSFPRGVHHTLICSSKTK